MDRGVLALVTGKDRVLDQESIGYADLSAKKPMDSEEALPKGGCGGGSARGSENELWREEDVVSRDGTGFVLELIDQ